MTCFLYRDKLFFCRRYSIPLALVITPRSFYFSIRYVSKVNGPKESEQIVLHGLFKTSAIKDGITYDSPTSYLIKPFFFVSFFAED